MPELVALTEVVEVTRSFSYKLNVERYDPSVRFESRDFFACQKAECLASDAERVSAAVYKFVKAEVMKAVHECIEEIKANAPVGTRKAG